MCSCSEMIGTSGSSAADSARYGISASVTMAATAGYRPASGPWRISVACRCLPDLLDAALCSGGLSTGLRRARVPETSSAARFYSLAQPSLLRPVVGAHVRCGRTGTQVSP